CPVIICEPIPFHDTGRVHPFPLSFLAIPDLGFSISCHPPALSVQHRRRGRNARCSACGNGWSYTGGITRGMEIGSSEDGLASFPCSMDQRCFRTNVPFQGARPVP